ncbi:Lrp/AsnC family transcriptional regulator [Phenylobacterium montanum]|uniref:Lrp/AsnC family transcriptional regulator n=1 Tax=Phenylobacterium montanum TaxID=2823693 RepID=A0A975G0B8_9CAUL|nr:Lrp/AsnC family transcriptional regulator [Caulobacter sp. S6]QUD88783.1 Lrp/AsnC family transcriptional regulator [Caulobacter sp. S6]
MSDRRTALPRNVNAPARHQAADSFVDDRDLKILALLQAQGRISNQDLAGAVNLSPSAALQRVRRLEAAGLIRGYHAEIDVEQLRPVLTVFAEVTLTSHFPDDFARFEAELAAIPEVVAAHQISGAYDYLLEVTVSDINSWRQLADQLLGAELGVAKITTTVKMKTAKPFRGYPI